MSKRDFIGEIKELQKRLPEAAHNILGHQDALIELITMYPEDRTTSTHTVAVSHYMAVRLVAILQSAFRAVIREAVDYNAQHNKLLPKIDEKITLQMVSEFANKAVTIGEFVAHLMPLNSLGQMQKSFEIATGRSLKSVVSPQLKGKEATKTSYLDLERAIQQLFKERNIICHEIRDNDAIPSDTLGLWCLSVLLMVSALGFYEADFITM